MYHDPPPKAYERMSDYPHFCIIDSLYWGNVIPFFTCGILVRSPGGGNIEIMPLRDLQRVVLSRLIWIIL